MPRRCRPMGRSSPTRPGATRPGIERIHVMDLRHAIRAPRNADGRGRTLLAGRPVLAGRDEDPHERHVAGDTHRLALVPASGSGPPLIFRSARQNGEEGWQFFSPDGTTLVEVWKDQGVWLADVATGEETKVALADQRVRDLAARRRGEPGSVLARSRTRRSPPPPALRRWRRRDRPRSQDRGAIGRAVDDRRAGAAADRAAVDDEGDRVAEGGRDLGRVAGVGLAGQVGRRRRAADRGPAASARGAGWSGTRTPIVGVPAARTVGRRAPGWTGRTSVSPPGQKRSASARGRRRRDAQRPRLRGVGEQHGDRLLGRPALGGEQALDRVGQGEVGRDPVDRVGGDRDDPPARGAARPPPRAPRPRRGGSGSSSRGGRPRPRPPAAPRCARRPLGRRQHQRLDQLADPVLLDRRRDVPRGRPHHRPAPTPSPPRARRRRSSRGR